VNTYKHYRMSRLAGACLGLALLFAAIVSIPAPAQAQRGKQPDPAARFKAAVAAQPSTDLGLGPASAELQWQDGAMQSTIDYNCYTGIFGPMTSEFAGYLGNSDVTFPAVGDIFYGRVAVGTVGNPCGGPYAAIEVGLPQYTSFAIDETHKVHCFFGDYDTHEVTEFPTAECPQNPTVGTYGWAFLKPGDGAWSVPQGKYVIVAFPLVATRKLSGIATNSLLYGYVKAIDGENNPWDDPHVGVFVAESAPVIGYPNAPATNISGTGAHVQAIVENHFSAGSAYVDYGTAAAYSNSAGPYALAADQNTSSVGADLNGLTPNTTYHWRVRVVANNNTYTGADQTFTTSGGSGGGPSPDKPFDVYLPVTLR
jgi:hypothetical protein